MITQKTEVIGTVRKPDGAFNGEIDGLVVGSLNSPQVIAKVDAISAAQRGLLWCRAPGGGHPVDIEARDWDGDGADDYVATKRDRTRVNNLFRLNILDRRRSIWLYWQGNNQSTELSDAEVWNLATRSSQRR